MSRELYFKSILTNFSQKNYNILLVIKFRRNFGISLSKFITKFKRKNIGDNMVNLTVQMEAKTHTLQLLFVHQFQNVLPNSILT